MRIVYIAAGAAGSYCGACKRDASLAKGLIARGHDVMVIPLYTPLSLDEPDPSENEVFYGGISVWLEDHSRIFRRRLPLIDRLLDNPRLLGLLSRFGIETDPAKLGPMTVSVLKGADGHQRKELAKLVEFLKSGDRPDVVHLTNTLLAGIAPAVAGELGCRVVCSLTGGESFLRSLPEPHRTEALDVLRRMAEAVDTFISPGESYADEMAGALSVERSRIRVVRTSIDLSPYSEEAVRPAGPFRIGFFSRIVPDKGLDILVEAFRIICREGDGESVLAVAGQAMGEGAALWRELRDGIETDGLGERIEYAGELTLKEKARFLAGLDVLALPSRKDERLAVSCIEAMASGTPLVVPNRGIFPEMIALTGGGVLVDPGGSEAGYAAAVAAGLAELRDSPARLVELADAAREGVRQHYAMDVMANAILDVYAEAPEAE